MDAQATVQICFRCAAQVQGQELAVGGVSMGQKPFTIWELQLSCRARHDPLSPPALTGEEKDAVLEVTSQTQCLGLLVQRLHVVDDWNTV